MCENPQYALLLKAEFDEKFQRFGVRTQMRILDYVRDVQTGKCKLPKYDYKKYHLLIKECGKCRTCRFKQAAKKSAQAYCESKTHEKNCFLTLTFDEKKLYKFFKNKYGTDYKAKKHTNALQWTLDKSTFTNFMKRLRFQIRQEDERLYCEKNGLLQYLYNSHGKAYKRIRLPKYIQQDVEYRKIKFLHCGEYGSLGERPHHHCLIFGYDFDDVKQENYWRQKHIEQRNVSEKLNDIWQLGDCTVDRCTYNSINYVSRYVTKKIINEKSDLWYNGRKKEYCTQSNRRGLGFEWFCIHYKDCINTEKIPVIGSKNRIRHLPLPRYFRDLWKQIDRDSYNLSVEKNIEKSQKIFESIQQNGLLSYLDTQVNKTKSVFNQLKRRLERTDNPQFINTIYKKAEAFGIEPELLKQYEWLYGKYIDSKSFRDWQEKYKNEDLHQRYVDFENYRKRKISSVKYNVTLSDTEIKEKIDWYNSMDNPYKRKGYTAKVFKFPCETDWEVKKEVFAMA